MHDRHFIEQNNMEYLNIWIKLKQYLGNVELLISIWNEQWSKKNVWQLRFDIHIQRFEDDYLFKKIKLFERVYILESSPQHRDEWHI